MFMFRILSEGDEPTKRPNNAFKIIIITLYSEVIFIEVT